MGPSKALEAGPVKDKRRSAGAHLDHGAGARPSARLDVRVLECGDVAVGQNTLQRMVSGQPYDEAKAFDSTPAPPPAASRTCKTRPMPST